MYLHLLWEYRGSLRETAKYFANSQYYKLIAAVSPKGIDCNTIFSLYHGLAYNIGGISMYCVYAHPFYLFVLNRTFSVSLAMLHVVYRS